MRIVGAAMRRVLRRRAHNAGAAAHTGAAAATELGEAAELASGPVIDLLADKVGVLRAVADLLELLLLAGLVGGAGDGACAASRSYLRRQCSGAYGADEGGADWP